MLKEQTKKHKNTTKHNKKAQHYIENSQEIYKSQNS